MTSGGLMLINVDMTQTQLAVKNTPGDPNFRRSRQKKKADAQHGIFACRALMILMHMVKLKHKENWRTRRVKDSTPSTI